MTSPEDPDGTALQLALVDNPAAKAFQHDMFQKEQPAAMFFTDDVTGDYERIKARGAEFTIPPTDVTYATIATLQDTCGNLIQITELSRRSVGCSATIVVRPSWATRPSRCTVGAHP